ncbi:MAG: hypothetical protein J6Y85_02025 [Alphaproteobacteria bacterium]|nr:hypothetical protein [Alphaproteobacteria bacterium]
MKNKAFLTIVGIVGISIIGVVYSVITTSLLLYSLKNRGILTSDIHYKFALASLDSRSITLYHVTSPKWKNAFVYKVRLTPRPNGFAGKIQNIHIDTAHIALKKYGGFLPEKLVHYQPATQFIQEWPLSIALFNLISPYNALSFNVQKIQAQLYQITLQLSTKNQITLTTSASINTQNNIYEITQAQVKINDENIIKQLQEYAKSKNQPIPMDQLTMSKQKSESKTTSPDNLTQSDLE